MAKKYYCHCDSNCKYETMTKEQILAAIMQAVNEGTIGDIDAGFITGVRTVNGATMRFFIGSQFEYEALPREDKQNLFAIITNDTTQEAFAKTLEELASEVQTKANKLVAPKEIPTKVLTAKGYYYLSATYVRDDGNELNTSNFGLMYWDGSKFTVSAWCGDDKLNIYQDGKIKIFYNSVDMTDNYQIYAAQVGDAVNINTDNETDNETETETETVNVIYDLTNIKEAYYPSAVNLGAPFYYEFYAKDGYELTEAHVSFNGEDITNFKNSDGTPRVSLVEGANGSCYVVNIDAVMGVLGIEIIAAEAAETHTVTYNLTNVTATGNAVSKVEKGKSFSCGFNHADGYKITSYNVMHGEDNITSMQNVNGVDVCMLTPDNPDVKLIVMVDNVSADIKITVTATAE